MASKKKVVVKTEDDLNIKRELFCQYYVNNSETFGNATHSYAEAFGYKLDELSKEAEYDEDGKKTSDSEYDLACNVCAVEGNKLLRIPQIDKRITVLLNELLKDDVVDGELAKLIRQNTDNTAKVAGIREYNKLRGRIIDKTQQINRLPDLEKLTCRR
ncbi:hypothetical protein ACVWZV_002228 [Bradyrhizobium sp. GM5.1]